MSAKVTADPERPGNFLAIHLEKQDIERKFMLTNRCWKPKAPSRSGQGGGAGRLVKAGSDWAAWSTSCATPKGELWLSCGTKDDWNCNDVHAAMFAFDGWRYLRFELRQRAV